MRTISESVYELLMAQGLANAKPVGAGKVRVNKGPALSTMASSGGVKADAAGGMHRPIGPHTGGGKRDQSGMGKGRQPKPAPVSQGFGERQHLGENGVTGDPFLRLVANNVDIVPTRQGRGRARLSLVRT